MTALLLSALLSTAPRPALPWPTWSADLDRVETHLHAWKARIAFLRGARMADEEGRKHWLERRRKGRKG